ncbi:MAG: long-chain-fatty-acid--CoA ligase [Kiloniellales bacterium]
MKRERGKDGETSTAHAASPYERHLDHNTANWVPLTPLTFLRRAAAVHPKKIAVIDGRRRFTYREFWSRVRRLASALSKRGIAAGDVVAVMAGNVPALLEAHYAVPLLGAVLNPLNVRQDAATIAYSLSHGGAKLLLAERDFAPVLRPALKELKEPPLLVEIEPLGQSSQSALNALSYEALLDDGDEGFDSDQPRDEWQAICLLYTSGTTGKPKGVVYHHRGAYLNAIGNAVTFGLKACSVYLWTLPMFHCSGWTYSWAVTAMAATHVCLRKVEPAAIYAAIAEEGVTHLCGAPVVLTMIANAPETARRPFPQRVEVATGGAAPPSAVIEAMEARGFRVTHLYGLTESYGPASVCDWQETWEDLPLEQRSAKMARQGQRYLTLDGLRVADPATLETVPADGQTIGEIVLRGNTVMKGYLEDVQATATAFKGGWFHSGDLAVIHSDGYVEIKDRAKDIIISGGENISSLEVEEVLYRHPKVLEAAVVARPDVTWGETPCAFVTPREGANVTAEELTAFCRERLAGFKLPKTYVFGPLPKTATGKVQKFALREQAKAIGP